jgi:hypothetical protein
MPHFRSSHIILRQLIVVVPCIAAANAARIPPFQLKGPMPLKPSGKNRRVMASPRPLDSHIVNYRPVHDEIAQILRAEEHAHARTKPPR